MTFAKADITDNKRHFEHYTWGDNDVILPTLVIVAMLEVYVRVTV